MKIIVKLMYSFLLMASLVPACPLIAYSVEGDVAVDTTVEAVEAVADVAADVVAEATEQATEKLTGTVGSIDMEEQFIVINYQVEGDEQTVETAVFQFSPDTKVMKAGEVVASSDLKEGDAVSVEFQTDADNNKVISVLSVE